MSTTPAEEFRSRFSSFFANLAAAFFIWLVGLLVFVPLSWTVSSPYPLGMLVSAAFLAAVVFFVSRSVLDGKGAIDGYEDLRKRSQERSAASRSAFQSYGYLALIALVAILVVPFLWGISAALGGIILVAIVFCAIVVAFPLVEIFVNRTLARNYLPS
jgi:hypothetical protein